MRSASASGFLRPISRSYSRLERGQRITRAGKSKYAWMSNGHTPWRPMPGSSSWKANSNSYTDLLAAVDKASELVASQGGGQVSISWGGAEFATETTYDAHFTKPGVTYFVAAGDTPGTSYPAMSPHTVAVGGTAINRHADSGAFVAEVPWKSTGAGPSAFEHRPAFQNCVSAIVGNARGAADVAAVADPSAGGVWIYNSQNSNARSNQGWLAVGGTSAATPIVAGIANNAGRFAASGNDELAYIYSHATAFTDIKSGTCGPVGIYAAVPRLGLLHRRWQPERQRRLVALRFRPGPADASALALASAAAVPAGTSG